MSGGRRWRVAALVLSFLTFWPASAAQAQPDIDVDRTSIDFGEREVGEKSAETIRVTNLGTANLTILATGAGPAPPFAMQNFGVFAIGPGEFWDGPVSFQPTAEGQFSGEATIRSDDPDQPIVTIRLEGRGAPPEAPAIEVDPKRLRFGDVPVGKETVLELLIGNRGSARLQVEDVVSDRGEFSTDSAAGFSLRPGRTRSVRVSVLPTGEGRLEGRLEIRSNDPDQPQLTVRLIATGVDEVPEIDVQPTRIDFGEQPEGGTVTRVVEIANLGTASLEVDSIETESPFRVAPPGPFTLQPNQTRQVEVGFTPGGEGVFPGRLEISSNDPDEPVVFVDLLGAGVLRPLGFEIEVSPSVVRLAPGHSANVRYRLREVAGQAIVIRRSGAEIELPDGRRIRFASSPFEALLPANGTLEIEDVVRLPSDARGGDAVFRTTFVGGSGAEATEQVAAVRMIPTGSFGADAAITTLAIDYPMPGTTVAPGSVLRARAKVFGSGSGSFTGTWFVDGSPVETFTVDLTGGRPEDVETLLSLPTTFFGPHVVSLAIEEPIRLLSEEVRYYVTPEGDPMRWLLPPGARDFLVNGAPAAWDWTPKAGALGYEVLVDGAAVARVATPGYTMTESVRSDLAPGPHRFGVRALFDGDREGLPLLDETLESEFRWIERPDPIEVECDRERCSWPPSGAIYRVVVEGAGGETIFEQLTAGAQTVLERLARRASGEATSLRVEAFNPNAEKVGESRRVALEPPGGGT